MHLDHEHQMNVYYEGIFVSGSNRHAILILDYLSLVLARHVCARQVVEVERVVVVPLDEPLKKVHLIGRVVLGALQLALLVLHHAYLHHDIVLGGLIH